MKQDRTCSRGHAYTGSDPCPVCYPGYRTFTLKAKVWLYPGKAAWHFVTLPKEEADDIKKRFSDYGRGWGSLPVTVTIGKAEWQTSIFPDKKSGSYLLPIKTDVRKKESIHAGDTVDMTLVVRV